MNRRNVAIIVVVVLAAAYWVLIARNISFAVGGSDSSGYISKAKMFASGRLSDTDTYRLLRAYAANTNLPWYAVLSEVVADIKPEEFPKKFAGNWK